MPYPRIKEILQQLESQENHEAWTEFLREYGPLVLQIVRNFERDPDETADCFQVICEGLIANRFRRLRKFRLDGSASFSTWLRAVVRNLCLDWQRRKFGRTRVFRSVARLPIFEQELFRCAYQRGLSNEECEQELNLKFPQVTSTGIRESLDRIEATLSVRQRSLLSARLHESKNGKVLVDQELQLARVPDSRPDPEAQAITHEQERVLARALNSIPVQDQLLIRMRFEEDLTLEQCARLLALGNAQRADRRIKEILERLRHQLT
jgi:DNA-directed RNA polymerase specialized sigma subunit